MGISRTAKQPGDEPVDKFVKKVTDKWVTILPKNPARQGVTVYNPTDSTVYLDYGEKGDKESYMLELPPYSLWESPFICKSSLIAKSEGKDVVVYVRDFS